MFRALHALTALAVLSTTLPAVALEAEQRVLKEVTVTQADGTEKKSYVSADLVTPGETVVYALVFRNDKPEPADGIVLVMPVPAEITYIEGSATNRIASADFSADGGSTYAARESLRVLQADGTLRPAAATDITHVRWAVAQPMQPGESGQLWYRGILN